MEECSARYAKAEEQNFWVVQRKNSLGMPNEVHHQVRGHPLDIRGLVPKVGLVWVCSWNEWIILGLCVMLGGIFFASPNGFPTPPRMQEWIPTQASKIFLKKRQGNFFFDWNEQFHTPLASINSVWIGLGLRRLFVLFLLQHMRRSGQWLFRITLWRLYLHLSSFYIFSNYCLLSLSLCSFLMVCFGFFISGHLLHFITFPSLCKQFSWRTCEKNLLTWMRDFSKTPASHRN